MSARGALSRPMLRLQTDSPLPIALESRLLVDEGDLAGRLSLTVSNDEFDRLAENLNTMLDVFCGTVSPCFDDEMGYAFADLGRLSMRLSSALGHIEMLLGSRPILFCQMVKIRQMTLSKIKG